MARLVRHDATGPIEVKPQQASVWICACGLTQSLPFCDGSHKAARKEEAGKCYLYDKNRTTIVQVNPDA